MLHLLPRLPLLLLLAVIFPCIALAQPEPKREIVIGLNPSERAENVQKNADILAQMISSVRECR